MCVVRGHKCGTLHIMGNQAAVAVRQCIACRFTILACLMLMS